MKPSRDDDSEAVATSAKRLLGAAKAFNPAVHVTFADIQTAVRVQRRLGAGLSTRLLVAGVAGLVLLLVTGGVALSRGWLGWRPRPAAPTFISVPAGATTRVERRGRFHLSLRGPGAVEIRGNNESLRLEEGSLQIENQAHAVVVEATGRQVEISPSSTVTIDLPKRGTLQVNSVAGPEPRIDGGPPARSAPAQAPAVPAASRTAVDPGAAAPSPSPVSGPAALPVAALPRPVRPGAPPVVIASTTGAARPPAATAAVEVTQIRDALARLRTNSDPVGALRLLDDHDRRFPGGLLRDEAAATRIEALLALGRSTEALERLDAVTPTLLDRSPRLRIARGELRASHGRCDDALTDFAVLLALPIGDEIEQRARRGRAACHRLRGEVDPAL